MKKNISVLIIALLLGIIILAVGFYYVADVPYQDPTPEMLAAFNRKMMIGKLICLVGGTLILLDLIGWMIYFISHSANSKKMLINVLAAGIVALIIGICLEITANTIYKFPKPGDLVMVGALFCFGGGIVTLLDLIGWIIYVIKYVVNKIFTRQQID